MFALFRKSNGLHLNSFSVNYRNSPLVCVDIKSQILNIYNEEIPIYENENPKPVFKKDEQSTIHFNTLPEKQYSERSKSPMCIESLKEINSLTFHVQEEETLDRVEEDLRDILEDLKLVAPHEAGLIKESPHYVRSSKGIFRGMLPKPKLKKSTSSG